MTKAVESVVAQPPHTLAYPVEVKRVASIPSTHKKHTFVKTITSTL